MTMHVRLPADPYLRAVIARIANHPINKIADLLPWNLTP
jgi:transposase